MKKANKVYREIFLMKKGEDKEEKKKADEEIRITYHHLKTPAGSFRYKASGGYMYLKDEEGKLKPKIFFTSYERECEDPSLRPITFAFNGGPGASSIWIQFGGMGPKRVNLTEEGKPLTPPAQIVDNEYTWLDFTDLVFIDPVGTGFSRADKELEKFCGFEEDIKWVGEFIRLYITKMGRWLSPKFIVGESYGTIRASGLSYHLLRQYSLELNGVILVSSLLNLAAVLDLRGHDLPYLMVVPAFSATAWYHKKLPYKYQKLRLEDFLALVEEWCYKDYWVALARGDSLPLRRKEEIISQYAEYTALSVDFVKNCDMRVSVERFTKEFMRDEGMIVGRLDSRYVGYDGNHAGEVAGYDPSFISGAYTSAIYDYVKRDLKLDIDIPYQYLSEDANKKWKWIPKDRGEIEIPDVLDMLKKAMCQNEYMKVLILAGYYDLATPYFGADFSVNHIGLNDNLKNNIDVAYYHSGHMIYFHRPSLRKMHEDGKKFYSKACAT